MLTSRMYQSEADLRQMQTLLMDARSITDDWHYAHIGDLTFGFFMVACHLNPKEYIRLWYADDRLVGYAVLGEDPAIDWQILPEYEWNSIEEEAMVWAETRLSELCKQDVQSWGGDLVSGARQNNTKRIAFLQKHGFREGGEFSEVNLIRFLDEPIPESELPLGCLVREVAEVGELSNRAGAQREVWQPWTVGNVSDDDYAAFMQLPGYDRELDVVAIAPDGAIAAYVNGWIDPVNRIGDLGPVGARPSYRRQGFTRAVLLESLRRMQRLGMNRVSVSTGIHNEAARGLYESVGFRVANYYLEFVKKP